MCGYLYLCRTYYAYHELCPLLRVQKALSKVCGAWIIGRRGGVGMAYGLVFQVGGGGMSLYVTSRVDVSDRRWRWCAA